MFLRAVKHAKSCMKLSHYKKNEKGLKIFFHHWQILTDNQSDN